MVRLLSTVTAALSSAFLGLATASAATLSQDEIRHLESGASVVREQTIERGDGRYVGGIVYAIVNASPAEVERLFDDHANWNRILPKTRSARTLESHSETGESTVELHQGTALVQASYALRIRKHVDQAGEGPGPKGRGIDFWLDQGRPHSIDDAWGFFRYEDIGGGRLLLRYGILVDMGSGILRELFEERLRRVMLSVPSLVQRYFVELRSRDPRKVASL